MTAPTKTTQTALVVWQSVANNAGYVGNALDVSGVHALGVTFRAGRADNTAHSNPYLVLDLLGNPHATDDSLWTPIVPSLIVPTGATIAATTLNGAVSAGVSSIVVTSASSFAVGQLIYIGHTTTVTNSEIARVLSISAPTLTLSMPLMNAHDNGAVVSNLAEQVTIPAVDLSGVLRVKGRVVNNSGRTNYAAINVTTVVY